MKTLKSVLLSTSLLMTVPFAAANVEQGDLPGVQAQSAKVPEKKTALDIYKQQTGKTLHFLLTNIAQVDPKRLGIDNEGQLLKIVSGLKQTLIDLKAKEDKLTAETTSLQTQLRTATSEKNELEKKLEHAKASITQLEQSNRQAGEHSLAKIRELTDALQKASEKSNVLYAEKAADGDRLKKLKAELAAKGGGVDNTQLTDAVNRVTELEAQLAAKDEEIQRLQSASDFTTYVKLVQERDAVTVQRDQRIEKAKHMEALEQLRTQLTAENDVINNGRIRALEKQLADAKTEAAEERTQFDRDLEAANKKRTDFEAAAGERERVLKAEQEKLKENLRAEKAKHKEEEDSAIAYERNLEAARKRLTELEAEKKILTNDLAKRERELKEANEAHARELKDANEARERELEKAKTELDNNRSELVDLRAANEKLKADSAARELELKDANEAHARELTAANEAHARELTAANEAQARELEAAKAQLTAAAEAHARELEAANAELSAANAKLSAANEAHARELEEAKTELSTQAHNFSVENEMLRNNLHDALRAAQANNGQATADVNQPFFDSAAADYAAHRANRAAGSAPDQSSRHSSASNAVQTRIIGMRDGKPVYDGDDLSEITSQGTSQAATPARQDTSQAPATPARQDTSQAPATPREQLNSTNPLSQKDIPLFSDDDTDNTSPSQLPASPPAAAATVEGATATQSQQPASPAAAVGKVEDVAATQIAALQTELAAAQAIVDKPDLPVVPVPGKNAKLSTRTNYDQYVKDSKQLAQDKAAAAEDVKRLTAELAALQPAQPAGN